MEKFITEERTGLRYELVGDYYLIAGDDEPEEQHIISLKKMTFTPLLICKQTLTKAKRSYPIWSASAKHSATVSAVRNRRRNK